MRLDKSSPAGLRLFSSLRAGRSLTKSARAAGVGKRPAQRWIREVFNELRDAGLSVLEAQESLGFASSLMPAWDHARLVSDNRHHLQRPIEVESAFWSAFDSGASLRVAMGLAGVGRSTGYRWLQRRFLQLREDQVPVRAAALALRLDADRAARWEGQSATGPLVGAERAGRAAQHDAVLTAARHAQAEECDRHRQHGRAQIGEHRAAQHSVVDDEPQPFDDRTKIALAAVALGPHGRQPKDTVERQRT